MDLAIQSVCGAFVVLGLFLSLLRYFVNTRPQQANADGPRPTMRSGPLTRLIYSGALVSFVLMLAPLERLWIA